MLQRLHRSLRSCPISTFFGAEAIFLVIFLLVCACGMRLLNENPVRLYLVLGVLIALAWLAKSSTTPFLVLFVVFSVVRWLLNLVFKQSLPWHLRAPGWSARRFGVGLVLCVAAYFALISPRLVHAQRTWGSPFYSLPSFWFWADDWETCVRKYADCRKVRLAELPIEEQPTMIGYFHRHGIGDALLRLRKGVVVRLGQLFHPEGKWRLSVERSGKPKRIILPHRGLYLIGLGGLALAVGTLAISQGRLQKVGPVTLPVLLGLATFAIYLLATGWYLPTGPGHRFIMTLYLPLLWMLAQGGEQLRLVAGSRSAQLALPSGASRNLRAARLTSFGPCSRTLNLRRFPTHFEGAEIFSDCLDGFAVRPRRCWNRHFPPCRRKAVGRRFEARQGAQNSRFRGDLRMVGRSDQLRASYPAGPIRAMVAKTRSCVPPLSGCPSKERRGWFWPLVIVAMALTAFWGAQRISQSLWDDEDSSLHRAVLGQYRRDKSGELNLRETTWEIALWNYWKPANHQLQTVLSKACLECWQAVARPVGLQFSETGSSLSLPGSGCPVCRRSRSSAQAAWLCKSGCDRRLSSLGAPLACALRR